MKYERSRVRILSYRFESFPHSFSKQHILDSSKLKEFADDNSKFKFNENGGKFSKGVEKQCGKRRNCS